MHVIARRRDDTAWPAPVWGHQPASRYSEAQVHAIRQKLKLVLTDNFRFAE
jgi:diadenosine tetraphosphate (Ap4A) HIT family hydrolase